MESWAIVPRKFTPCSSISLTISLRPPSPMATPSSRYFQIPFAAKPYLLRLYSANSSHTSSHTFGNGICSSLPVNGDVKRPESSDFDSSSLENPGSNEKSEKSQAVSSNEILTRLKRYGVSGVLAYGLLNTAYYLTTFLVVWLYVAPAPGRMGYSAAVERFLKVMAMVWAGSQVTKLMRAGGALALAPFVERGLSWFTAKFGFESQGKAFMTIAGFCFGLAFVMFIVVTLLWA